ncbi:hypothetical protein F0562_014348 [Nyssa sinensis]|uniref:Rhamnogalacturonan endolyase n=1 Tax=Nyssa sinensis TaxID=561372 RepID=A0A5J4ZRN0_9ASTE|nr:hypothetical protein F0562_014348 [Nyssa sinensis]
MNMKQTILNKAPIYWDINWSLPGGQDRYQLLKGSEYNVIHLSNDQLEVSFRSNFDPSTSGIRLPLSVDLRYILRSGASGFYCYAIYDRPPACRAFDLAQTRMVFKLRRENFHYMAITDEKQRIMPMPEDLLPDRSKQLIVPESRLLINPINPDLKGEVDDKYLNSIDNKVGGVHGWISSGPIIGFWVTFPSQEFRNGGPTKQNLSPHWSSLPCSVECGSASGRLFVQDRFVSGSLIPAKYAYVGLSAARTEGSWQTESKDYQFWVQTDSNGNFTIRNVIPGVYGLQGWVSGFIGFQGTRNHIVRFRQYGLWDRYTDIHPEFDQAFTIAISDPKKDWFFAHVDRRGADKYLPTTWTIKFNLNSVTSGTYKMRLATASATRSDLEVYVNNMDTEHLVFQVMNLGTDNTVCRHGTHGLYRLFNIDIPSSLLIEGDNSMFLNQARGGDALCGILYDYIRLEAPATLERP